MMTKQFEEATCSQCSSGFKRLYSHTTGSGLKTYKDALGRTTRGGKCHRCFSGKAPISPEQKASKRKQQMREDLAAMQELKESKSKLCPVCKKYNTPNRYACNACWASNRNLNNQDAPSFTKTERDRIMKEVATRDRFNY